MNFYHRIISLLSVFMFIATLSLSAQTRQTREEYIDKYKNIAIEHMERYGIPASITLAQGILESDCGNSNLARRSNNHFGIKCKSNWTGERVYHTDDAPDECFRKYDTVEESYEDHAKFLDQSPRYDSLFAYKTTDYHSWARGLKAAGYATAPDYAQRLTRIIEENKLYLFDEANGKDLYVAHLKAEQSVTESFAEQSNVDIPTTTEARINPNNYRVPERTYNGYSVFVNNNTHFIIASDEESFDRIASTFDVAERTLRRYNEVNPKSTANPIAGEKIYIEQKQDKWMGDGSTHSVKQGETLTSISQEYGIRLNKLARMNRLRTTDSLQVGQSLKLK